MERKGASRPNILIFMTDQQRGDSVLHPLVPTPHLDRFRAEGITFTQAFCPSPHCCPSRASFFTGLYPSRHGVWNNVDVANALSRTPKEGIGYFSDLLREEGYPLDFSGKWHVSREVGPADAGWRIRGGAGNSRPYEKHLTREEGEEEKLRNWQHYETAPTDREGEQPGTGEILRPGYPRYTHYGVHEDYFGDRRVTDEAVDLLLNRKGDAPWIQFVGLLGPHDPYMAPPDFLDGIDPSRIRLPDSFDDTMTDKPGFYRRARDLYARLPRVEQKEALRHYYAFCSFMDDQFGRVLAALDQAGERENTLVLYVSDHGDYAGEHGLWTKGLAGFRGAYHIPAVMRWPGGIVQPGRQVDALLSLTDFAPTFLEVARCGKASPHKGDLALAGRSLVPFFNHEDPPWREELYGQTNGNELYGIQRMVFDKKYKFLFNGFDYDELYNLEEDPGEMRNLIPEGHLGGYTEIVREYYKKLWRFARENGDQYNNPYIHTAYPSYGPGILF